MIKLTRCFVIFLILIIGVLSPAGALALAATRPLAQPPKQTTAASNELAALFPSGSFTMYGEIRVAAFQNSSASLLEIFTPLIPIIPTGQSDEEMTGFLLAYGPI